MEAQICVETAARCDCQCERCVSSVYMYYKTMYLPVYTLVFLFVPMFTCVFARVCVCV